jgi:recombination protein RecA
MAVRRALQRRVDGGGNYFASPKRDVKFITTGGKTLDLALGGGWAEGRVINIVGDKSTGKTLLIIEASANFAKKYPKAKIYYREVESAFEKGYAKALGMPIDRVDFGKKPIRTVEQLYDDLQRIIQNAQGHVLYAVDSLDALSDASELDRGFGEASYGAQKAKDLSKLFRMIDLSELSTRVTLMIVSQVRDKIGATFGRKWTRSGGRALDFYASQVVYLAHLGVVNRTIDGITRATGVQIKAKLDKNKIGLPFREAEFDIQFGYGIDDVKSCYEFLKQSKSLERVNLKNNISDKDLRKHVRAISALDNKAYAEVMKNLHQTVEQRWYEIDNKFMPTRRKYGD